MPRQYPLRDGPHPGPSPPGRDSRYRSASRSTVTWAAVFEPVFPLRTRTRPAPATRANPPTPCAGDLLTIASWTLQALAWAFTTLFIAGYTSAVRKT